MHVWQAPVLVEAVATSVEDKADMAGCRLRLGEHVCVWEGGGVPTPILLPFCGHFAAL